MTLSGYYNIVFRAADTDVSVAGDCHEVELLGERYVEVGVRHKDNEEELSIIEIPARNIIWMESCSAEEALIVGDTSINFVYERVKKAEERDDGLRAAVGGLLGRLAEKAHSSSPSSPFDCEHCPTADTCKVKGLVTA